MGRIQGLTSRSEPDAADGVSGPTGSLPVASSMPHYGSSDNALVATPS